jgi:multidrug efflux system outer membrane protein
MRPISALAAVGLILTTGCTVGPNYRAPAAVALKVPPSFNATAPSGQPAADLARWWQGCGDPVLTTLVDRALAANLDIDIAGSRLRQSRAMLASARGAQLPSVDFGGSVARSIGRDGGDATAFQAGLDVAYAADLFGGTRRSVEAARADSDAAVASLHTAQLVIAAEVASTYLDAVLAESRLRIARGNLASQDETLQIVGWRVQAGLVSSLDLEQSRQLRAQTAATLPVFEAQYLAATNRLAVLVGEAPGAVSALVHTSRGIPAAPSASAAAIPIDVIQRRPDIATAERRLAAETARIGVETAQLYPALRLGGSFGGSGSSLRELADASIGNVIANLTAPIFEGGRIRAAIDAQDAATAIALSTYRQSVLVALEEVENALTAVSSADRRAVLIAAAQDAASNSAIYSRSQYRTGLIDFRTLLDAERSLLLTQDSVAVTQATRATAAIQLYKALGGGWQAAPPPASVTASTFTMEPK